MRITLLLSITYIIINNSLFADTVIFTKQDSADWTLPENQDRITDNVWITRKHNQSIFNIAQEEGYSGNNGSPMGTLWADTATTNADSINYTNFVVMHGGSPQSLIGDTVSMYIPQDGLYFDVIFLSYSGGSNTGGGFSYSRMSINTMTINNEIILKNYRLHQNHPNPFNPVTTLRYDLPEDALVNITIYDMMGRVVSNLVSTQQNAGYKSIQWNATNNIGQPVSAGLYLYTIQAGEFRQTKKMVLLK
jgi:hypothetical protein